MNRIILTVACSFFCCCLVLTSEAQTTRLESEDMFRQLLSMPAPTPRTADSDAEKVVTSGHGPRQFFDKDKAPADDAALDELLGYWYRWVDSSDRPGPSERVRQRLLDAGLADPEILERFLPLLSPTEATATKVKELWDQESGTQEGDQSWREKVKKWLVFNSKYFLSDLLALANKVKDNDKGGYVEKGEALTALAKVDWQTAEPLLHSLLGRQPRTTALAITLFYRHSIVEKEPGAEDRYRSELKAIAADRDAPASARDIAIEALLGSTWSGRDEWYLSLFQDETLLDPSDGSYGFSPLTTLFVKDPDKWIPVMTKLVEGRDQTARSAAASCLIVFQNQGARPDALKPLLPWLSNPEWAKDRRRHRLRLIQSMEDIDLPESVPGLIWAVEHDDSEFSSERSYAAQSLARYKDLRAVPALKKALATEENEDDRRRIIHGLLASGGLTETEQVKALEEYAAKVTTAADREQVARFRSYGDEALTRGVSIGVYLSSLKEVPSSTVRAVLSRATVLQKSNPTLAQSLLDVAHGWQGRHIDLDLIHRIGAGTADAAMIANALERRARLRERVGLELQSLVGIDGAAPGIAAALLDDGSLAQSVLSSGGETAQVGLLACARLTQMPLPLDVVGKLMQSRNQLLAAAAEGYLLAEDSKAARELLWLRHPGEAFITGWRETIDLGDSGNFDAMRRMEQKLQTELFKENSLLEIFAVVTNSGQYSRVLRVYQDRAIYTRYDDPSRYRERVITKQELAVFRSGITTQKLEDLGPQFGFCHHDCATLEFLSLTKEKGRRVFSRQGYQGWPDLTENFDQLRRGRAERTHYLLENEIKGLEVLYEDEQLVVKDVWQRGADLRIFVEREETPEESNERRKSLSGTDEDDDEAARGEHRRLEAAREKARFSWRTFANNKPDEVTSQPEGYSTFDDSQFPLEEDELASRQRQFVAEDSVVLTRNFDGLWRQTAGQKAVRISGAEGAYGDPVVTPDRKWVVVAKTDSDWSKPNYIVRLNLQTRREYRVNVPPADRFDPIAYVSPHGKMLLRRAKDQEPYSPGQSVGPNAPEYYLLDAATGETKLTTGVFDPLHQEGKRFLQPTGKPNEFWAAIAAPEKDETRVGRYNLKDFSFHSVMVVPHINFDSMSMWVDEAGAKLYLVYNAQLLRLPLLRSGAQASLPAVSKQATEAQLASTRRYTMIHQSTRNSTKPVPGHQLIKGRSIVSTIGHSLTARRGCLIVRCLEYRL